ncbi:hypothetical protein [Pseudomonas xionganensis]|uniref:Uncharacterized protein n=1 Tax=Pseudomonas xionganensis TaxID=2654845 RepID=A0A6I4KSD3_9PSED|nr:hypothetical protein [Pseudomonas xionganensis]MVW75599.1 hypothetical protein [Pseudomonas xionganensis]
MTEQVALDARALYTQAPDETPRRNAPSPQPIPLSFIALVTGAASSPGEP